MNALRIAVIGLLLVHGTIHLLGFVAGTSPGAVPGMSGRTLFTLTDTAMRVVSVTWLATAAVFLAAGVLSGLRHEAWAGVALAGVVLSQALVVFAWPDAKFGTLPNVALTLAALGALGVADFSRGVDAQVAALVQGARPETPAPLEESDLAPLPPPVRAWLTRSGVLGRPAASLVRLTQHGRLRTSPGSAWMEATAEQTFSFDPPSFVWSVRTTMAGVIPIVGVDTYRHGSGRMRVTLAGLFTVVDAHDTKVDQGALLRFLAETVWFPSAVRTSAVRWEAIDARRARATMYDADLEVSALFTFDASGRVESLVAERWYVGTNEVLLRPWRVECTAYGVFDGVEVPTEGVVIWDLPTGDFPFYRWSIDHLARIDREAIPR